MAAVEDFHVIDTQVRDIFRANNPQGNRIYWIITRRYAFDVCMCPYDVNDNMITGNFISISLEDLDADYTYVRRNPVDPLHGGKKRRSLKNRRTKRRKSIKKRSRKY
jgi:hypothetical protein